MFIFGHRQQFVQKITRRVFSREKSSSTRNCRCKSYFNFGIKVLTKRFLECHKNIGYYLWSCFIFCVWIVITLQSVISSCYRYYYVYCQVFYIIYVVLAVVFLAKDFARSTCMYVPIESTVVAYINVPHETSIFPIWHGFYENLKFNEKIIPHYLFYRTSSQFYFQNYLVIQSRSHKFWVSHIFPETNK